MTIILFWVKSYKFWSNRRKINIFGKAKNQKMGKSLAKKHSNDCRTHKYFLFCVVTEKRNLNSGKIYVFFPCFFLILFLGKKISDYFSFPFSDICLVYESFFFCKFGSITNLPLSRQYSIQRENINFPYTLTHWKRAHVNMEKLFFCCCWLLRGSIK